MVESPRSFLNPILTSQRTLYAIYGSPCLTSSRSSVCKRHARKSQTGAETRSLPESGTVDAREEVSLRRFPRLRTNPKCRFEKYTQPLLKDAEACKTFARIASPGRYTVESFGSLMPDMSVLYRVKVSLHKQRGVVSRQCRMSSSELLGASVASIHLVSLPTPTLSS